jgi:hypothetical protein
LRTFVSKIEGKTAEVTETNWSGLWELSGEFGFGSFAVLISSFGLIPFLVNEFHI